MNPSDTFDRILASLHEASFDDAHWPAASILIDKACGAKGNGLIVAEGDRNDARVLFAGLYRPRQPPAANCPCALWPGMTGDCQRWATCISTGEAPAFPRLCAGCPPAGSGR